MGGGSKQLMMENTGPGASITGENQFPPEENMGVLGTASVGDQGDYGSRAPGQN